MSQHTNLVIFVGDIGDAITKILPLKQTLSYLDLGGNAFTGKLFVPLTDMSRTNCTAILNYSAGPIPSEIGALTELTYLSLGDNSLSGNIRTTLYQNPIQKSH